MRTEKLQYQMVYLKLQKMLLMALYNWDITPEEKKKVKQWIKEVGEIYQKTIKKFD